MQMIEYKVDSITVDQHGEADAKLARLAAQGWTITSAAFDGASLPRRWQLILERPAVTDNGSDDASGRRTFFVGGGGRGGVTGSDVVTGTPGSDAMAQT